MLKSKLRKIPLLALLMLFSGVGVANNMPVVDIVIPTQNPALEALVQNIAARGNFTLRRYIASPPDTKTGDILVVVSDSLLPLLNNPHYRARIGLYINSTEYKKYVAGNSGATSAVFSDQPLARQLDLISALYPQRPVKLGLAYQNPQFLDNVETALRTRPQFSLQTQLINSNASNREINQLIQQCQVLLATPEKEIYNPQTIRGILLGSYRHQVPLVGPSEGFVDAGALASVISQPEDYASELLDIIQHFINSNALPKARPPKHFQIKLNHSVAKSLGITLPSEEVLLQQIGGQ